MAQKEATVYIVDVGSSMGECSHGRTETNLDFALEYVWDKITTTVATGRKTAMAGVVALRTDGTNNELEGDGDYFNHISVLQDISQIQMAELRKLRRELVVSDTQSGDAMSALIIAVQMIVKQCKKLQYARKVVLVTDARAPMDTDQNSEIVKKLKEDSIELVVLGVDFDDPDFPFKEEDKDEVKAGNEVMLRQLCEDCDGVFGTLAQAVDELQTPRLKTTKAVPSYKGTLTLGDPESYETALTISVERYPKTMVASAPSASSFVVRHDLDATQSTATLNGDGEASHDGLAAVKTARTYQVEDENAPGGKLDLDRDQLAKGYEYGRTAVHINESDRNVTMFESQASLDIIGFVDAKQYDRFTDMSRTNVVIAERTNEKAYMALSSLIHALYELESYAVARFVAKENKDPHILLLQPAIEADFECLYDVELPFSEDVRSYKFPPLDKVITVSGKTLTLHRNLPSDELKDAMSDYVDSMDLSAFDKDDEGQPTEYMPLDETYSVKLHRINQVIKHRAIYPDRDPPETPEILLRYSRPPTDLLEQSQLALDSIIKAADVKKVSPKARGKRFGRRAEAEKPLSNLDIDALLAADPQRKTRCIDPKNAVPEFKQMVESTSDVPVVEDAVAQLKRIIYDWVQHSVGESGYGRAVEGIRVMREMMVDYEMWQLYNGFLEDLKGKVLGEELGGERREMWLLVRNNKLGLVTRGEVPVSTVDDEEAKAFYRFK